MAEILIHCNVNDYSHSDPEKDQASVFKKGYVVDIQETGFSWGLKEGPPKFVIARVTDASVAQVKSMANSVFGDSDITGPWIRKLNWEIIGSNLDIDGHRIKLSITNPGNTNIAAITRDQVESYLNNWNAQVFSVASNEVVFDVAVYEDDENNPGVLQSTKFWDLESVNGLVFGEQSYDSGSGDHRVSCDYSTYSNFGVDPKRVEAIVATRGGIPVSNIHQVIIFDINRSDVFTLFKEEVRNLLEKRIYPRKFRIPEATVDNIISGGGTIDVTLAQLQSYLINRLDEDL